MEAVEEADLQQQLKQFKQRDLFQTYFFKVASRTFGPPKSRDRVIVAPPQPSAPPDPPLNCDTEALELAGTQSRARTSPRKVLGWGNAEGLDPGVRREGGARSGLREWVAQRKHLREQLDRQGDVRRWIQGKPSVTELEMAVAERTARGWGEREQGRRTPLKPKEVMSPCAGRGRQGRAAPPALVRPTPPAQRALQQYLCAHRLQLRELFLRLDRHRTGQLSRDDFRTFFQQEGVPVDESQLDDLVSALGGGDAGTVSYRQLVSGGRTSRLQEREALRSSELDSDQSSSEVGGSRVWVSPQTSLSVGSGSPWLLTPTPPQPSADHSSSPFLEVPPPCLEEGRPLGPEEQEELGRLHRHRRRTAKGPGSVGPAPCRVVRTGSAEVDGHALPSTLGGGSGEAVDRYRRRCLCELQDTLRMSHMHAPTLRSNALHRGLLYPGDSVLGPADRPLRLRQPGMSPAARPGCGGDSRGGQGEEEEGGFVTGVRRHRPQQGSRPVYPPRKSVQRGKKFVTLSTGRVRVGHKTDCWLTLEEYEHITRNLKPSPSRRSDPDAFWPGRALEGMRLYLPQTGREPEAVLFQPIRRRPAPSPGSWPISTQGYCTSGDIERHKTYQLC